MNMNYKISGKYLIIGGIAFFLIVKLIRYIFPNSLITQSISTVAELTWFIIVGIGIVVFIRERKEKKEEDAKEPLVTKNSSPKKQRNLSITTPIAIIIVSILCIGSVFLWYLMETKQESERRNNLENCINKAMQERLISMEKFSSDNSLSKGTFDLIQEREQIDREYCYEMYGK
ncbi:MAG: hypothetical protein EOL97_14915 [Spirochaetia bacterium]|nr:hypothetical protein [Spirochaetia bacterium]